ncbi:COG1361 S-layer family protein [Methanoplanus endosymbiosus]|uniref:CARDB domain-containing protein n=1 Tax=Methanoplanus endosymbiosus TaxID=33865 RepID=A0A9E7TLH2_9EURY|nr:CARDB domain-containing protein [Methanoplanus endosymbiosus]UUX93750.1 hypothetical protein L6E24_06445 [Methanoplanus endosymbiosus]
MNKQRIFSGILMFLIIAVSFCGIVSADDSESSAYTQVAVTDVNLDPGVFVKGDTGIITITVKNTGTESVSINRAELYSNDISVVNDDAYDTVTPIGAGNEMQFSFTVDADAPDGIYYPRFYLDYTGSNSFSYNIPVKIESTGLSISVIDSPDSWQEGNEEKITLLIGNPRENTVNGVEISPLGEGVTSSQTSYFIGNLEPDESCEMKFDITPEDAKYIEFDASWRNGINKHISSVSIPVSYGDDKTGADPILNNVETKTSGSYSTVSGDITNAGLEDAMSIVVTVGSPAVPVDPYKIYVIGSLEPDDFSSFDVTYELQSDKYSAEIPVIITYKDLNGNDYEKEYSISSGSGSAVSSGSSSPDPSDVGSNTQRGGGGMMGGMGGGFSKIPVLEIVVIIIAGLGLVVIWKKGYIKKGSEAVKAKLAKGKK